MSRTAEYFWKESVKWWQHTGLSESDRYLPVVWESSDHLLKREFPFLGGGRDRLVYIGGDADGDTCTNKHVAWVRHEAWARRAGGSGGSEGSLQACRVRVTNSGRGRRSGERGKRGRHSEECGGVVWRRAGWWECANWAAGCGREVPREWERYSPGVVDMDQCGALCPEGVVRSGREWPEGSGSGNGWVWVMWDAVLWRSGRKWAGVGGVEAACSETGPMWAEWAAVFGFEGR
ncbi:hypothetical protein DFH08DRAFT_821894 [Mycena albidolilacea]|uniref:Uncharacterized protein n=1 Tax=Mycena albidolilacea TaxID=1033008 RepID=A0AAD6Z9X5_9AGAR|nr:hypothetical protein DFH08DRAFT_821894 [Mycena albidolilacea]